MKESEKLELLQKRIASLSPEKRAIFEQRLKQQNSKNTQSKILPRQDKNIRPLSSAQERLWFLHQLDPNNKTYNIAIAWNFQGILDINIFKKTFLEIIKRHEILRTTYSSSELGKSESKIQSVNDLSLPIIDLRNSPQAEIEVKSIVQDIARESFDLAKDIPIRLTVVQLNNNESKVIIVLHHIVADGWSRGILLQEFSTIYQTFSNNLVSPLKPLEIQYVDYAVWEKQWLKGKEQQVQLDYWKKQLNNLTVLNLPIDFPRPPIQTFKGKTKFFNLSSELTEQLKLLSRQQGVTLFMTLLTAFKILLHRYTQQEDIAVGSLIANRNLEEIKNLIGFFVNTLVLRSDLSNNPTFTDLLIQIRTTTNSAYKNQDFPFAKLVEALHPERNLSHNPFFQVMFQFQNQVYQAQNSDTPELAINDLNLSQELIDLDTTKFDLTWNLIEKENSILAVIEYSTDLYQEDTINRMFGHFQTLLENIISNPQCRLSELSILTASETQQILIDWNQIQPIVEYNASIHQLFEEQAQKNPHKIAVEDCSRESLTYLELDRKANQLASYLRSQGVTVETKVGVCLERSLSLIVSLLAILKTGAAYVPLDPNYPQTRLDYIVEDSNLNILLTQSKYQSNFGDENITLINLDSSPASSAPPAPQNLAYIIYTSGSTGNPKGVAITHKSVVTLCNWAKNTFSEAQLSGVLASTSICFDLSVFEIFVTLSCGGSIIIAKNALELPNLNPSVPITLINTVPSVAKELLRTNSITESVTTINLAGEALPKDLVDKLYQRQHIKQVYNLYGPSEDTTYSTFTLTKANSNKSPTIGNVISNTQAYILDKYLQPLPIGIPGELYLAGAGLARGYYNRSNLTAEKFIPNPFVGAIRESPLQQNTPIYKTGDLAKYLSNGEIEYLGRLDNQIKIRGFRIELGEIETVLTQHSTVESALVTMRDNRLIAYIIPCSDIVWDVSILRLFLETKLPSYMIPNNFVTLKNFPLNSNGKIDRKALPIPKVNTNTSAKALPQNPKEIILTKIWQEVLNLEKISTQDNFFELGGDSILSIQIIARARQAGLSFTPKQLFQYQTIAKLATVAEENKTIEAEQKLVTGEIPLTPIQHWLFEQDLVDFNHYNQAVLLDVQPNLNSQRLELSLQYLVFHHDALRISFSKNRSEWIQFNLETVKDISFITIDLTHINSQEQKQSITETTNQLQTSLDITQGKMITGALFRLGNKDQILLIIHHLVIDGVSWRILLEDLVTCYQQLEQNKPLQLPHKTTSYKQWATSLKQYAQQAPITKELDYWLQANKKTTIPLPIDKPDIKTQNTIASTEQISISLDSENTHLLLTEVPKAYNTRIDDVLLTALSHSFYLWTKSPELLLDLENYGRKEIVENIDTSRTIGWFTSIYPIKLKIDSFTQPGESLKSIKEQLRAYPQQGFNYSVLKYLNSQQKLKQLPSPEIAFNYLGQIQTPPKDSIITRLNTIEVANNRSPYSVRRYLIEIYGAISNNKLNINWIYSNNFYEPDTMTELANDFLKSLKTLINHCQASKTKTYTPSDFSAAKVNQNQLDALMSQINKSQ